MNKLILDGRIYDLSSYDVISKIHDLLIEDSLNKGFKLPKEELQTKETSAHDISKTDDIDLTVCENYSNSDDGFVNYEDSIIALKRVLNEIDDKDYEVESHRMRMKSRADADQDFSTFSDRDLLEYTLFQIIPRTDTKLIAHNLLTTFGSVAGILSADVKELMLVQGVGENVARLIKCISALISRTERMQVAWGNKVGSPNEAITFMRSMLRGSVREQVCVLLLDKNYMVITGKYITRGAIDAVQLDIAKIIMAAHSSGAKNIILAHNHPSGNPLPSFSDTEITIKCALTCNLVGIGFVDHLIFGGERYYSYSANVEFNKLFETKFYLPSRLQESPEIYEKLMNLHDKKRHND